MVDVLGEEGRSRSESEPFSAEELKSSVVREEVRKKGRGGDKGV